jgi:hypothetical protein
MRIGSIMTVVQPIDPGMVPALGKEPVGAIDPGTVRKAGATADFEPAPLSSWSSISTPGGAAKIPAIIAQRSRRQIWLLVGSDRKAQREMDPRGQEQFARARCCLAGNGGPPVGKRKTDGFGRTLIDTVFADAKVEREFRRDGFVCTMELALREAAADGTGGEPEWHRTVARSACSGGRR